MTLADEIARPDRLTPSELRAHWSLVIGGPWPRISSSLLRQALAWELQAKALAG